MKKINGKFYAKVDIIGSGSFMVFSKENLEENDILQKCVQNELMDDDDVDFAVIDTFIDDYDLNGLKKVTYEI